MTDTHLARAARAGVWGLVVAAAMVLGTAAVAADDGYRLAPEDVLEISVWKEDGLQREVLVRPDGKLSFPLVGSLDATGKTAEQLQAEIEQRLEKFIPDPVVTVSVLQVSGNKIYVIGKVNQPGMYPVGRPTDVMQALSLAGGLTPFADEDDIRILRRVQGRQTVLPFDYAAVATGKGFDQNVVLQPGDVVVVR